MQKSRKVLNGSFGKIDIAEAEAQINGNKGTEEKNHSADNTEIQKYKGTEEKNHSVDNTEIQISEVKTTDAKIISKEEGNQNESREIMEIQNKPNQEPTLENGMPLAMEVSNMMEVLNSKKEDLDKKDMIDNIREVAVKRDLSPNQTKSLKKKHGKRNKKK
ncbi:hypothetical protein FXO38_06540 [Capsicum annuum]|nr:hypothetical protein FXO38_06540 [Capsicum annuum]